MSSPGLCPLCPHPWVSSPSNRDTSRIGRGPHPTTSLNPNYLFKGSASKYSHLLTHWGLGREHVDLEEGTEVSPHHYHCRCRFSAGQLWLRASPAVSQTGAGAGLAGTSSPSRGLGAHPAGLPVPGLGCLRGSTGLSHVVRQQHRSSPSVGAESQLCWAQESAPQSMYTRNLRMPPDLETEPLHI